MNFASDNARRHRAGNPRRHRRRQRGQGALLRPRRLHARVERGFAEMFEREVAVFLVTTGTAANALALAQLTPPWGAVLCHGEAHIGPTNAARRNSSAAASS